MTDLPLAAPHGRTAFLSILRGLWPLVLLSVLVVGLTVLVRAVSGAGLDEALVEMLLRLVIVIGLFVFVGNTGIISFGHVGFVIIGAYATAWQTCCYGTREMFMPGLPPFLMSINPDPLLATVAGGLLAAAVALVAGLVLMRLTGIAASIGTFAFFIIVHSVYMRWDGWTGGTRAVIGIPTVTTVWTALAAALFAMLVAFVHARSRTGISARAARDDEVAARASGVDVLRHRLAAFVLSAFLAGLAGGMLAQFLGMLTLSAFYLDMTFITLAMLVLGGQRALTGAVVGTIAVSVLTEVLRRLESDVVVFGLGLPPNSAEVGLGVLMLLILLYRADGLCRNREISWPLGGAAPAQDAGKAGRRS